MLTPEEIENRDFLVSLRGYDRDEVHAFLSQVARDARELRARVLELEGRDPEEPLPPPEPATMFAEIGRETQRILEAAQEAGDQLRRKARQEADKDIQQARAQAAKLIADGERRREAIEAVVETLEERRGGLADSLRDIGRTVEQILRDTLPEPEPATTVREALATEASADLETTPVEEGSLPLEDVTEPAEADEADEADEAAAAHEAAKGSGDAGDENDADDADAETVEAAERDGPSGQTSTVEAVQAEGSSNSAETVAGGDRGGQQTFDEAEVQRSVAVALEERAEAVPPDDTRAERTTADQAPLGAGEAWALRSAALGPLHPKLVRKLKRGLQDLENATLDRVRRARRGDRAADLVPGDADFAVFGESAREFLADAFRSGAEAASRIAGRRLSSPEPGEGLVEPFVADAAAAAGDDLVAAIAEGRAEREDIDALGRRVAGVFAWLRDAELEGLAAFQLLRAYEHGVAAACSAGQVTHRRWLLAEEPPCPEERCADNAAAGPVPAGELFPSGHSAPPTAIGCSCATVPATEG